MRLLKEAGVTDEVRKTLIPVIDNVAWMKSKLDEAREFYGLVISGKRPEACGGDAEWRRSA